MSTVKPCIFCEIVAGKSPETIIEFSNEHIVIFKDIRPASEYHYLAVPKNHMPNVRACTADDKDLSKWISIVYRSKIRQIFHIFRFHFFGVFSINFSQFLKCKMSYAIYSARKM